MHLCHQAMLTGVLAVACHEAAHRNSCHQYSHVASPFTTICVLLALPENGVGTKSRIAVPCLSGSAPNLSLSRGSTQSWAHAQHEAGIQLHMRTI